MLKHVYMGQKFQRILKLDIPFSLKHFFFSVAIFTQVASAPLMGSFHFFQWKIFFRIHWQILKILGNQISQSFILSLKCDHPLLCEFSILFSTVKLKLEHKFFQFINTFNIGILKCWSGTVYISKFFPIHKRDAKLGFWKPRLHFQIFPNSLKSLKLRFCHLTFIFGQMPRLKVVFQYDDMWCQRGANLWLN